MKLCLNLSKLCPKYVASFFWTRCRVIGLHIFVCDGIWVYLHSNLCTVHWAPKDAYFLQQRACVLAVQGRSRSSNVDNFGTNRKRVYMRPPISPLLWLWSYLAPFLRYGDLLTKMPIFHTPLSFGDPAPYVPFGEVNHQETKLSSGEEWRPHDRSLLTWYRTVTDRQTDGQTESIIACRLHAALCIASYADAL